MKEALKAYAQDFLGEYYVVCRDIFSVFVPFLSAYNRMYWLYLIAFFAVAFILYMRSEKGRLSIGNYFGFVVPKSVFLHPSAILTYKYYAVNGVLVAVLKFLFIIVSTTQLAAVVSYLLESQFGPSQAIAPGLAIKIFLSLALITIVDFASFFVHYLFHKYPVLWEFHKVHHCPEQITPFTNSQHHPVEIIARSLAGAILSGTVVGIVNYTYLGPVAQFTIFEVGLIFFAFNILANFRHSHMWLAYPKWLSPFLSSPAMHQIHHSKATQHLNKNYAVVFSFWDWMFGTIYIPQKKEDLSYGLADSPVTDYDTLVKLYHTPFKRAFEIARTAPPAVHGEKLQN